MPVVVKCVLAFRAAEGYGWTETHYWQSSSDEPNLAARIANLQDFVGPARAQLLGAGCDITGLRVSYPRQGAIASRAARVFLDGPDFQQSSSQSNSLAVVYVDTTSTRKKIVHLRGFWDSVEENQLYNPNNPNAAGWSDRFIAWKQTLIQGGYGWLSKDAATSTRGLVTGYTEAPDQIVSFTVVPQAGPALVAGEIVTAKFSKINNSKSVLNRALLCEVVNPTLLRTTAPIAAGLFTGQGRFQIRRTAFVGYADTASVTLGERRMGSPLGRYPGRSKARART